MVHARSDPLIWSLPTSFLRPGGSLRILIAEQETYRRVRGFKSPFPSKTSLSTTTPSLLNTAHSFLAWLHWQGGGGGRIGLLSLGSAALTRKVSLKICQMLHWRNLNVQLLFHFILISIFCMQEDYLGWDPVHSEVVHWLQWYLSLWTARFLPLIDFLFLR